MAREELKDLVYRQLCISPDGSSARDLLAALSSPVSQPTLWRALSELMAEGRVVRTGNARAVRYHASRSRLDRARHRSRLIHRRVAQKLLHDPGLLAQARDRLSKLREVNPHGRQLHDRWDALLRGNTEELLRMLVEPSDAADLLRKESPFSTFLTTGEREAIFRQMK